MTWFGYLLSHPARVLAISEQHALLSVEGTVLAALVAIPFAIWAYRRPRIRHVAASVTEIIQTLPSLAVLAVLMIWLGIGDTTLVVALFLYALMPMLHNTVEGLLSVSPDLIDTARGLGMSRRQIMIRVQLPIAAPIILTGFRVALVTSIGIATIGVFVGAGGLGKLIYSGIQRLNTGEIFAGAAPAAAMAIIIDGVLAAVTRRRHGGRPAPGPGA